MLVELTIHGRPAALQRASKDDEGDNPCGIHIASLCI